MLNREGQPECQSGKRQRLAWSPTRPCRSLGAALRTLYNRTMAEPLIHLESDSSLTLQSQIRQRIVAGIVQGTFPVGSRLPSSRKLAKQLGISRNTVVLAYEALAGEGFIEARQRSGIYVRGNVLLGRVDRDSQQNATAELDAGWRRKIRMRTEPSPEFRIPRAWHLYPFPFIEGYFDASLYPTAEWREASRLAMGSRIVEDGVAHDGSTDDPDLIEQIRTKMLPRRGITAGPDEILITVGEQNALYLVLRLLSDASTTAAMEEPGNPRLRQLLRQSGAELILQPVDAGGMEIDNRLDRAQLICVTPSHQVPTAVTMDQERREALLALASRNDQLIIEDDVVTEHNYLGFPHAALRAMDRENRVIYLSGLPKMLSPGLRIGFIVASPALIREARKLRQLVTGRPGLLAQRTAAVFLSLGHYDATMARLHKVLGRRWEALRQALNHYHRETQITLPTLGGTSLWIEAPEWMPVDELVNEAAEQGILMEPDVLYYGKVDGSRNFYRLSVTSLPEERIREGVYQIERLVRDRSGDHLELLSPQDSGLLDGSQMHSTLAGATIRYRTFYGDPCTIELHPDGRMLGRAGFSDEDRDEGRWWVEDDLYCRRWDQWAYGEEGRYQVTVHDNTIRWWRPRGRLIDSATFEPAQQNLDP